MNTPHLIARKRDGHELSESELRELVTGFLDGAVAPEQMSAFLMAGVLNGFTIDEARALTEILLGSGQELDLSGLRGPVVDKHSTGGVADTTTLIVAPLLAAAGVQVAKLSGAGLGHTGGTVDKLAAIPGFDVELPIERMLAQVERVGIAVSAASADLAPAEKKLYALRDVTGTVPSPGLIASSIMSKKLAAGAPHVLLDIKAGSGGNVGNQEQARALAQLCSDIGTAHGRRMACLVTDMSQPLGSHIGNALEVLAAIEVLAGRGDPRLRTVALALADAGLRLAFGASDAPSAEEVLASGRGLERFGEWVEAQGGPASLVDDPAGVLPTAPIRQPLPADRSGVVVAVDPRGLGEVARELGAGRHRPGDVIDPAVGLELHVRPGDEVGADTALLTIHARSEAAANAASEACRPLLQVGDEAPPAGPDVVLETLADT